MTRQAVTKHLVALERAGLVHSRREAARPCTDPIPAPLRDAGAWLERVGAEWDERLAALARHVERRKGVDQRLRTPEHVGEGHEGEGEREAGERARQARLAR